MSIPYLGSDDWVTPLEASRYFGRSFRTIQRWLADGTLEEFGYKIRRGPGRRVMIQVNGKKIGRVTENDIERHTPLSV